MSEIQEMAPQIGAFRRRLRDARDAAGLTNSQLSELSGVPYGSVCKIQSGETEPKLYSAVAMAKATGMSIDAAFGIEQQDAPPGAQEKIHEMELKCSDQAGDVRVLEAVNELLKEQVRALKVSVYLLAGLCTALAVCLAAYMVIDYNIPYAGLIQVTGLSGGGWLMLALLLATAAILGWLLLGMSIKHSRQIAPQNGAERGEV